jgi:uncharacterized protein (DUF1800 family)
MRATRSVRNGLLCLLVLAGSGGHLGATIPSSAVPGMPDDRTIVHVLSRLGFGPRPGDLARVRQEGLGRWIDRQLAPSSIPDTATEARLEGLTTLTLSSREIAKQYYEPLLEARRARKRDAAESKDDPASPAVAVPPVAAASAGDAQPDPQRRPEALPEAREARRVIGELTSQKLLRAVYSERQLQEVLTDFWFNHFNVFAGKGLTRVYLTEYERDAIRPHVLGRFRDLLGATAKSPAMLFYLDNARSADPSFAERAGHDMDRMADAMRRGTGPRGARNGMGARRARPIDPEMVERAKKNVPTGINENYARELMELHTLGVDGGYSQQDIVNVARAFTGWTIGRPRSADAGDFRFNPRMHDTGEKIVLGQRIKTGGGVEDGERVLDILAAHPATAHFIALKLARRLVSDAPPPALVERAAATFQSTGGDLRAVVRTIVTAQEFFAPEAYRAKVKTPFEFVVSALRATGADITTPLPLARTLQQLGMPLYFCQPPTGYKDSAEAWVNTGALLNRMNFAVDLAANRLRGIRLDGQTTPGDIDAAVRMLLADDASEATRATMARASEPGQVVALALGSPEFQRH